MLSEIQADDYWRIEIEQVGAISWRVSVSGVAGGHWYADTGYGWGRERAIARGGRLLAGLKRAAARRATKERIL